MKLTKEVLKRIKTQQLNCIHELFAASDEMIIDAFQKAYPNCTVERLETIKAHPKEALRNLVMDVIDKGIPDHWLL